MKKIAIVDPSSYTLPYDTSYIKCLSKKMGIDFFCSMGKDYPVFFEDLNAYSDNVYSYKISPSSSANVFFGIFSYLKMLLKIYSNRGRYDVINFQWSIFFPFEFIFFILLRDKVIFTIHNDVPHGFKGRRKLTYYILSKISRKNIFVSEYTKKRFSDNYFENDKNIVVQHGNMYFGDYFFQKKERNEYHYDVIFWGRVESYKGIDILLTLKSLGFEFGIYGRWSTSLNKLKNEMEKYEDFHIFDEYINEEKLIAIFNKRAIFILPYKAATQSGVLYTFLAYRVVFIASDVGENAQFLRKHNFHDLIFKRDDPKDIIRAFNYARTNYDYLVERLDVVSSEYEWSNILTDNKVDEFFC
ncbi:glycosyltransferase [Marinomonas shanghaiensis]|uniref:glycosyltransferase n=1 Tax=Marinomonas shanghaiensis TaxID=2202418 RepID=UPI000DB9366D|nr:glycosyltransferase [Marinomonas shanghaiensis]